MQTIKSISIPNPCQQSWQQMTPEINGRHCRSCCTTVIDFTAMSNAEVIAYLTTHTHVCGRFDKVQFVSLSYSQVVEVNKISFWKKWSIAALFVGMLPLIKAEAKPAARHPQELREHPFKRSAEVKDSITYYKITGTVRDDDGPIPGATVTVKGTSIGTVTNAGGYFELVVPSDTKNLFVRFIGYESKEVKIHKKREKTNYDVNIKLNANVMGEVTIVDPE